MATMTTSPSASNHHLPSCNGCKQRKLKCSRQLPICANCKRLDISCEYVQLKNKPGMKSGVVDQLTRRIQDLEHKLYDEDATKARLSSSPAYPSTQCAPTSNHVATPKLNADLGGLSAQIQNLSSCIGNLVSALPPPSDMANQEPSRKRARVDPTPDTFTGYASFGSSNLQPQNNPMNVLEGRILKGLVDAFFQHVGRWIPMVQENTFRRKLLERKPGDALPLLVHAMVVCALRILNQTENIFSETEIEEMIEFATTKVILLANTTVSVESLQSLIILAFTLLVNGQYAKAWPIIGSLTRSIEYLQLNIEEREQEAQTALLSPYLLPTSEDWVEEEERRRVFWNIFILDRICSATAGYRIALTGDNVWRRLPLCGTHWNTESFAVSPYFGIWDRSASKIDTSIAFLPQHYPSPEQSTTVSTDCSEGINMDTVGAFAYYVESLESLCRVDMYFLRQKVDFNNRDELSSWLTRFKELDMRLVHWKMFLPSKWKDADIPPEETGRLDPNMTLAHMTHNTSTILLHQRIGYPEEQLKSIKLPTFFSAETCRLAAGEIATIARKYLASSSQLMPLSPQFCFCLCISARALLVHWQHYGLTLDSFFWVLVEALDEAARRCYSSSQRDPCLAALFADQLRQLHNQVKKNPEVKIRVLDSFGGTQKQGTAGTSIPCQRVGDTASFADTSRKESSSQGTAQNLPLLNFDSSASPLNTIKSKDSSQPVRPSSPSNSNLIQSPPLMDVNVLTQDNLSGILDSLGDSAFMDLDRVISLSDLGFP